MAANDRDKAPLAQGERAFTAQPYPCRAPTTAGNINAEFTRNESLKG